MGVSIVAGRVVPDCVQWLADSGHAWLRVPRSSCAGLVFSAFSYDGGAELYLEEDCDAGVWLRAHGVSGCSFPVLSFDGECFVRTLPRIGSWVL